MTINHNQLEWLNRDYEQVTGKSVRKFVCPITLRDDPDQELCNGQVLNDGIRDASKAKVVQRKDVDTYFGGTLEPDLIYLLNMPRSTMREMLPWARELTIKVSPSKSANVFFADPKARAKFQQVDLFDPEGKTITSAFLRDATLEAKLHKDLEVEWLMKFNRSAILGSMLKSAYLAFFRLFGYRWVLSPGGDKVRRSLAAYVTAKAGKAQSVDFFAEFSGAFNVTFNNDVAKDALDTIDGRSFWLHFAKDNEFPILFARTCLFKVNGRLMTVTVPDTEREEYYLPAYKIYQTLMRGHPLSQNVLYARFEHGSIQVDRRPVSIVFGEKGRLPRRN